MIKKLSLASEMAYDAALEGHQSCFDTVPRTNWAALMESFLRGRRGSSAQMMVVVCNRTDEVKRNVGSMNSARIKVRALHTGVLLSQLPHNESRGYYTL